MRRAGLAALLACGCASYSGGRSTAAPPSASASYAAPSTAREHPVSVAGAPGASGGSLSVQPGLQAAPTTPNGSLQGGSNDGGGGDEEARREATIARWEAQLQRGRDELAATATQCRVICMAASNVCTATREICRLTGDLIAGQPRDVRCARARSACVDAGRRRDGACPVCPER